MSNTFYAAAAAALAMVITSGLVAFATAAPSERPLPAAEAELVAHLDGLIAVQVQEIKRNLIVAPSLSP